MWLSPIQKFAKKCSRSEIRRFFDLVISDWNSVRPPSSSDPFCKIITWVDAVSQSALRMGVEFIPEFNGNIA